jgi:signal transduction histidine kinase/PAS domain-containing protein
VYRVKEKTAKPTIKLLKTSKAQHAPSALDAAPNPPAGEALHLHAAQESLVDPLPPERLIQRLGSWFVSSTFVPSWLPERLQLPVFGYLIAISLQMIAVLVTVYLDALLRVFVFAGLLEVLAIALVALSWGVGPSVLATLSGACLFDYIVLPPQYSWHLNDPGDIYQLLVFVLIGLAISIVASQTERARRQAEQLADSLAKEHARLEAIIETVPDIVTIYDRHGRMVQMNENGRQSRVFGPVPKHHSLEALLSTHEAFTLSGQAVVLEGLPMALALHGETVESQEIRFLTDDGSECFLSISAAPLLNIRGKVDGVVSVTRDLSALHRSEREAANRAIELEAIFQSLADGIYVVDTAGSIIHANPAFMEIIGYTRQNREEFLGFSRDQRHALLDVRDEQGHPLPYAAWPETRILGGEVLKGPMVVDLHLRTLDGRELQLNVSGAPLYNREGELVAALCICRDVTERRRLEQRTHDALDALLAMAEAMVMYGDEDGLLARGRDGDARGIALRMARLTSRVLSCPDISIFLIDPTSGLLRPMAAVGLGSGSEEGWRTAMERAALNIHSSPVALLTARLQAGEVVLQDLGISPFTIWKNERPSQTVLVAPMSVEQQLIGLLVLSQNGDEERSIQEEMALAGAVAQLLALVFERERMLHERAEAQATEMALRAANQHMEEFLGMVSHELKTPLTSIKGNTQLAVRQLRNSMQTFERIFSLYDAAEQQTRRLNRLVDDLLDVSRAQAGRLELIPGRCDLRTLVHEALREQQKVWPARVIHLSMDEEVPLPLEADADRVMQVISNYLTNALKYSEPEWPVSVNVQREGREAYLAVCDQGPGLPVEEQASIWERFHRARGIDVRSSSHSSQAGLGLGLYISRTIIEGQGGTVGVQSQPGTGSTFWFRLPLAKETREGAD